jgi:hypothetical protein
MATCCSCTRSAPAFGHEAAVPGRCREQARRKKERPRRRRPRLVALGVSRRWIVTTGKLSAA